MKGINTFTLKWIALLAMLCDHIGHALFPDLMILRIIGRISFPIFAYVLVEGFCYTRDVKKYMTRLGVMAILSEIPFDLMASQKVLEFGHQNVFFTLFLGILMLYLMSRTVNPLLQFAYAGIAMMTAEFLKTDYRYYGILIILWFYYWRSNKWVKYLGVAAIMLLFKGWTGCFTAMALVPIALHNGRRGPKLKWFFYIFYPLHALVIGLLSLII